MSVLVCRAAAGQDKQTRASPAASGRCRHCSRDNRLIDEAGSCETCLAEHICRKCSRPTPLKNLHDGSRKCDWCIDKQHIAKQKASAPALLRTYDKWNEASRKEKLTAQTQQQKKRKKAQPHKSTEDGPMATTEGRGSRQRAKKRAERSRQEKLKRKREELEKVSEKNRRKRHVVRATQQRRQQQRRQERSQPKRR